MANLGEANIGGRLVPAWLVGLTAEEMDGLKGYSSTNLFDNHNFSNPVDQRGGYVALPNTTVYTDAALTQSTGVLNQAYRTIVERTSTYGKWVFEGNTYYTAASDLVRGYTGDGFGIDRMRLWGVGAVQLIKPDGLYFFGGFHSQAVETSRLREGETYTLSLLAPNGLSTLSFWTDAALDGTNSPKELIPGQVGGAGPLIAHTFTIPPGFLDVVEGGVRAAMWGQENQPILGWKLERGTRQTLAHQENGVWVPNEIPNYGEQLAGCKRYRQLISSNGVAVHKQYGSTNKILLCCKFETEMAGAPQLSLLQPVVVYSTINGSFIHATSISRHNVNSKGIQFVEMITTEDLSSFPAGCIGYADNNDDIFEAHIAGLGG